MLSICILLWFFYLTSQDVYGLTSSIPPIFTIMRLLVHALPVCHIIVSLSPAYVRSNTTIRQGTRRVDTGSFKATLSGSGDGSQCLLARESHKLVTIINASAASGPDTKTDRRQLPAALFYPYPVTLLLQRWLHQSFVTCHKHQVLDRMSAPEADRPVESRPAVLTPVPYKLANACLSRPHY